MSLKDEPSSEAPDISDAMGVYQVVAHNAPVHARLLDPANESRLSVDDTAAPLTVSPAP